LNYEEVKKKLQTIEQMKEESSKRLSILETKKQRQIREIENRFIKLEEEVINPVEHFEIQVFNGLIHSFEDLIMNEIDIKRANCEYCLSEEVEKFRNNMISIDIFPKELIARLDQVISGKKTIEDVAFKLEDIREKYIKPLS
jgi:hypothetical protein